MAAVTESFDTDTNLTKRFSELVDAWRSGRGVTSSSREMSRHPAYQAIIDLGTSVVPLILREMEQKPDHWFIALREITGTDAVAIEHHGNLIAMTADWIAWARANGIRW